MPKRSREPLAEISNPPATNETSSKKGKQRAQVAIKEDIVGESSEASPAKKGPNQRMRDLDPFLFKAGRNSAKFKPQFTTSTDAVEDLRAARLAFVRGQADDWDKASIGDKFLMPLVEKLTPGQTLIYLTLRQYALDYIGSHIGDANCDNINEPWVWNWPTWHRLALRMAVWIFEDTTGDPADCWLTFREQSGLFKYRVPIIPGVIESHSDSSSTKGLAWYPKDSGKITVSMGRITTYFMKGPPPSDSHQASHLCHNIPQICLNPNHIIWETDAANKTRTGCTFGSRLYCPHPSPKCIFTNTDGRFLRHRNAETWVETACDCVEDCHLASICVPTAPSE